MQLYHSALTWLQEAQPGLLIEDGMRSVAAGDDLHDPLRSANGLVKARNLPDLLQSQI